MGAGVQIRHPKLDASVLSLANTLGVASVKSLSTALLSHVSWDITCITFQCTSTDAGLNALVTSVAGLDNARCGAELIYLQGSRYNACTAQLVRT